MQVIGKKKKGGPVTGTANPEETSFFKELFGEGWQPAINEKPCGEIVIHVDKMRSDFSGLMTESSLCNKEWWSGEYNTPERGLMRTPTGAKIYYCQAGDNKDEISGASYPDICLEHIGRKLHNVWLHYCGEWKYAGNPINAQKLCGGPNDCPHVEHMKECDGNSYIDECTTHIKGNCLITNNLQSQVDDLETSLEETEKEFRKKEFEVEELRRKISELEGKLASSPAACVIDINRLAVGDKIRLVELVDLEDMSPDGNSTHDFFCKGNIYTVESVDVNDRRWDIEIKAGGGCSYWSSSKYFVQEINPEVILNPKHTYLVDTVVELAAFDDLDEMIMDGNSSETREVFQIGNKFVVRSYDEGDKHDICVYCIDDPDGEDGVCYWVDSRYFKKAEGYDASLNHHLWKEGDTVEIKELGATSAMVDAHNGCIDDPEPYLRIGRKFIIDDIVRGDDWPISVIPIDDEDAGHMWMDPVFLKKVS